MATSFRNLETPDQTAGPLQQQPANAIVPGPEVAASPSDPAMLRRLYEAMLRCRMAEDRAEQLMHSRKLKPRVSRQHGLEGASIGSLIELRAGDVISSEMGFAALMSAGLPLGLYFADLYGASSEYLAFAPEAANSVIHLLPSLPTTAAKLNVAAGFALALRKAQRSNVVLVHLPDSANALGYWHEAAALAAAERLPLIFFAISELASPNTFGQSDVRQRAGAYGIPGIAVDGGDVVAVWRVTQESIHRARGGAGPTLIDSQLLSTHRNSGSPVDAGDPLVRMQRYLEQRRLWKQEWKDELTEKFAAEIEHAESSFSRPIDAQ